MDPRHPELAISRLKELIKQYDSVEEKISHATTSAEISQAEREGGLVIQEICLVAPRIHEAMMQSSRNRRYDLTHGVVVDMSKYEVPARSTGEEEGVVEETVEKSFHRADIVTDIDNPYGEISVHDAKPEEYIEKPKKKTTRKKKTTKKKADK